MIRFVCAFVFFGVLLSLLALRFVSLLGLGGTILAVLVVTLLASLYAARHGDEAWEKILRR